MNLRFLSVCSGIDACSVAWNPLGWSAAAFSEIEPFPSAVLAHHYPDVPNLGDMTKYEEWPDIGAIDVLVGGTPCQSFSVAGNRGGLTDARGNLCLTFCELADKFRPAWCLWENVPGCLSSADNAFGCFLGRLCGAGAPIDPDKGKWTDAGLVSGPARTVAWCIRDAQYFGLAQRRRRLFVLAVPGPRNWRGAAALFPVGDGLCWNPPPRGKARKDTATGALCGADYSGPAGTLDSRNSAGGFPGTDGACDGHVVPVNVPSQPISHCLNAGGMGRQDYETETLVTATLTKGYASHYGRTAGNNGGIAAGHLMAAPLTIRPYADNASQEGNLVAFDTTQVTSAANRSNPQPGDPCHPLTAAGNPPALAFNLRGREGGAMPEVDPDGLACQRAASGGSSRSYVTAVGVRRLTPRECKRLQGFPDDYLDITFRGKPAADGPKYKALGNSMATNVMAWIGRRIEFVIKNY